MSKLQGGSRIGTKGVCRAGLGRARACKAAAAALKAAAGVGADGRERDGACMQRAQKHARHHPPSTLRYTL